MARGYVQKKHGMWFGVACSGHHQNGSTNAKYDPNLFLAMRSVSGLSNLHGPEFWMKSQPTDFSRLESIHKNTTPTYNPWDWYICLHEWLIFMEHVGT